MVDRPRLLTMPTDKKDPNFLGDGTSKSVWKWKDFAIVNATDKQRDITQPFNKEHIREKDRPIQMEYNFTVYLHELFMSDTSCPFVIPRVYLFQNPAIFRTGRFRYAKELCQKVVVNDELVNTMIAISDYLSDHGWVYLDMKPANLGMLDGKICILDTDYKNFYRVPDDLKEDFRNWSYLIIVMFSYLFLRDKVKKKTLADIIISKHITEDMLKELWKKQVDDTTLDEQLNKENELKSVLIDYGNAEFKKVNVQQYIKLEKKDIACPSLFYLQYGQRVLPDDDTTKKLPLEDFQSMMKYVVSKENDENVAAQPNSKRTTVGPKRSIVVPKRSTKVNRHSAPTGNSAGVKNNTRRLARPAPTPRGSARPAPTPRGTRKNVPNAPQEPPKGLRPRVKRNEAYEEKK